VACELKVLQVIAEVDDDEAFKFPTLQYWLKCLFGRFKAANIPRYWI